MRCNNCGFENNDGIKVCVKCGYTLQESNYATDHYQGYQRQPDYDYNEAAQRPTVINPLGGKATGGYAEAAPRPTVLDPIALAGRHAEAAPRPTVLDPIGAAAQEQRQREKKNCPHCGYLVLGNFQSCPNCGGQMDGSHPAYEDEGNVARADRQPQATVNFGKLQLDDHVTCENCGMSVSLEYSFCPNCGKKIVLKTMPVVHRRNQEPPKPKCSLTLIPDDGEKVKSLHNDYEGASVTLTRENTEPTNRTITSKPQAELTCEDGKWYIVNLSELNSTMLLCSRKMEVQPGDIVVLGDRKFRFEAEEAE